MAARFFVLMRHTVDPGSVGDLRKTTGKIYHSAAAAAADLAQMGRMGQYLRVTEFVALIPAEYDSVQRELRLTALEELAAQAQTLGMGYN